MKCYAITRNQQHKMTYTNSMCYCYAHLTFGDISRSLMTLQDNVQVV